MTQYCDDPDTHGCGRPRAPKRVTYREIPLTLSESEYATLRQAAMDDPVAADRLARAYVEAQTDGASWPR